MAQTFTNQSNIVVGVKPMPEDGILFKGIRLDGTDFRTARVQWAPPEGHEGTWVVKHPHLVRKEQGKTTLGTADPHSWTASDYLSASVTPLELPGSSWPMRILRVRALGEIGRSHEYPGKVAAIRFEVVEEIEPWVRFGPQGALVALLAHRWSTMDFSERSRVERYERPDIPLVADYTVASSGLRVITRLGMNDSRSSLIGTLSGWGSGYIYNAVTALMVRHTIGKPDGLTQADYDQLTAPCRLAFGPLHPLDKDPLPLGSGRIAAKRSGPRPPGWDTTPPPW